MAFFVITGKNDCPNCTHALHVASYLSSHLPYFKYHAIVKPENEWIIWLDQINSMNNWHQTKSPVIWKEISRMGAKAYLIGGLGEFWEYCYDYYGFQSRMSKADLALIMADNQLMSASGSDLQCKNITILGASFYEMLEMLIYELQTCFELGEGEHIDVKLYDYKLDDPEEEEMLLDVIEGFRDILNFPESVSIVTSMGDGIKDCDILIIIDDFSRRPSENPNDWLQRCKTVMLIIAEEINSYAKRSMRVILNHLGPVCFNASVLMEYCTIIRLANIVAVTADEGIAVISMMAEKVGELVENFWCPPVWGFSGLLSYISLQSTPIQAKVFRPYKRALTLKANSQLPKGELQEEIRFLSSLLTTDDALYEEVESRKRREVELLGRQPILAKIRAIGSLLRLWFAKKIGDELISLGICSNGIYGFPPGICFSQIVTLNEKRVWQPVSTIPLYPQTILKITEISLQVENTFMRFGLGERFSIATHQL